MYHENMGRLKRSLYSEFWLTLSPSPHPPKTPDIRAMCGPFWYTGKPPPLVVSTCTGFRVSFHFSIFIYQNLGGGAALRTLYKLVQDEISTSRETHSRIFCERTSLHEVAINKTGCYIKEASLIVDSKEANLVEALNGINRHFTSGSTLRKENTYKIASMSVTAVDISVTVARRSFTSLTRQSFPNKNSSFHPGAKVIWFLCALVKF